MENDIQHHKVTRERGMILVSCVMAFVILINFYFSLSTVGEPSMYGRLANAIVAFFCFVYAGHSQSDKKNASYLLSIIIGCWGISVFCGLVNGATSLLKPALLFDMIFNVFFAYILITKQVCLFPIKIAYLIISAYLAYTLLFLGLETTEIFYGSSGSMIGTTLISIAIVIQYIDYRDNYKIPIIPSLITLFLCTFSYSRSSIICSLFFFIVVLFFSTRNLNNKFLRNIPFLIIVAGLVFLVIKNWDYLQMLDMYEKFERKGVDADGRDEIWEAYLSNLDMGAVLFGIPIDKNHLINGLDNPHNIILRLHSQFGLFAFIVYYSILVAIVRLLKKNPFIALLICVMVLRGMFDIAYFFGDFDYIFLALVFEKVLKREKIRNVKMSLI